uniref:Uncharacterized protein n=1 Tax=Setaria viridis TaxID=4556 RepID=A0A4U6UXF5_SETVI|nr:hypothetical protein SEVIR_4G161901v2 [Setaria viridis]
MRGTLFVQSLVQYGISREKYSGRDRMPQLEKMRS